MGCVMSVRLSACNSAVSTEHLLLQLTLGTATKIFRNTTTLVQIGIKFDSLREDSCRIYAFPQRVIFIIDTGYVLCEVRAET
jgi:hypothetical protein